MKISVMTPIKNEKFFIPFWWNTIKHFADEVVIGDSGYYGEPSHTQVNELNTLYPVKELKHYILDSDYIPYSDEWNEGSVRNQLLRKCTGDIVFLLDVDEIINLRDVSGIIDCFQREDVDLLYFKMIPFWNDLHTVRINTPEDPRWHGVFLGRVVRNGCFVYGEQKHHCLLREQKSGAFKNSFYSDFPIFHLHYGFGDSGLKYRDNRRGDLGSATSDDWDHGNIAPDFYHFIGKHGEVKTCSYEGPWPEILTPYLNGDFSR
mgnify:CR=1 FL=1